MAITRRHLRDTNNPWDAMMDRQFIDIFRLPKDVCLEFVDSVTPFMKKTTRIHAIPAYLRVLAALRFFATGK